MTNHLSLPIPQMPLLKVAVTYFSDDESMAKQIVGAFQNAGIFVWTPDQLVAGGTDFHRKQALESAHFIVPLISSNSMAQRGDHHKYNKFAAALMEFMPGPGMLVFPILLNDCKLPLIFTDIVPVRSWDVESWQGLINAWAQEYQRRVAANDWN